MPNSNATNDIGPSVDNSIVRSNVRKLDTGQLHDLIVAHRVQGKTISQIARELNVTRRTVYAHLRNKESIDKVHAQRIQDLIPVAIQAVHDTIAAGDGRLGHQVLKDLNVLSTLKPSVDNSLTIAINTLIHGQAPPPASHTIPSVTVVDAGVVTPHRSSREGEGDDLDVNERR